MSARFRAIAAIAAVDAQVAQILAQPATCSGDAIGAALADVDLECILEIYDDIVRALQRDEPKRLYHYCDDEDRSLCDLKARGQVPSYYANLDTGQTIWCRKMLSIAGLRNLILFGPEIFEELRMTQFSGCMDDYQDMVGPKKMKHYTGNSVDLDTVVLRCSDGAVLRTINAQNKHKGLPLHNSTEAFAASPQAREIAIATAGQLIESFCADFALVGSARRQRRLDFDAANAPQQIPRARSNRDRGRWPLWQYVNEGVNSYHANVPNMPDIYGALILAPWHLAKIWCTIHSEFEEGPEREKWIADFFEDAVADSCFNGKWKAIEEFCGRLGKLGSIVDRLQKLQQRHQAAFAAIYGLKDVVDAEKDQREAALLLDLCRLECPTGRDRAGRERTITEGDCAAFVADPGTLI